LIVDNPNLEGLAVEAIPGRPCDHASIEKAAAFLGNSLKELNEMHFIPLFLGIAFGIALGTVPIAMPGLPQPLRLGLAGGVLVVALVLGRLGRIGRLVWLRIPRYRSSLRSYAEDALHQGPIAIFDRGG
jgi:uncharacterized transporter YbjL